MDSRLRGNDISCLQSLIYFVIPVQTGIQFLFFSTDNRQPAIGNVIIESSKSTKFSNCQIALLPDWIFKSENKKGKHMMIFEGNYGWFVALSSLLIPNFNALLNPIQGLLRKPRLPLIANFLLDFYSTVFYEKISICFPSIKSTKFI